MRAVPEAWFSSTVEKDDVKIIKMFYDISAVVSYGHWYDTIPYYYGTTGSKKPGPSDFIFTFLCAFYSIYILIINTGMMP